MKHYITTKPNVMGGVPCIVGTRIPVSLILIRLKQGLTLKKIQATYDWVPLATFKGALAELAEQVGNQSHDTQPIQA